MDKKKYKLIIPASSFNDAILDNTAALKELFKMRKEYARMFLVSGNDKYLSLVERYNDKIKLYLGL